jgi:two-component system LytT family response regulator
MTVRVVIADDEALGRRGILARLARHDDVSVVAECASGEEALEAIASHRPDLAFLDVQMPGLNGLDAAAQLGEPRPYLIFVTAYDQHALRAFQVQALDYLLKPIDDVQFEASLARALQAIARDRDARLGQSVAAVVARAGAPAPAPAREERLAVKTNGRIVFVRHADIQWVGAERDYVRVHAGEKSWLARQTMTALARELGPRRFLRIHRSTIVNIDRIQELRPLDNGDYTVLLRDGMELRLSRNYGDALVRLGVNR